MIRFFLAMVLLGIFSVVSAQNVIPGQLIISGVVKDANTGRPVPFASVTATSGHIGTVTNLDGEFTLKLPVPSEINGISISHLGYIVAGYRIDDIKENFSEFYIEPHNITIQEVIIRPTDAREIVASAINSIGNNYPDETLRLTAFYRETIKQRRDYVSISEAVVEINQAPYGSKREKDMFRIVQGRKSGDVKKSDTLLVKLQGGPNVSMMLDIVKNPDLLMSLETLNFYDFELTDVVKIDEESNYVIRFTPRVVLSYPLYQGQLYISVERLAFTMADFSLDLSDKEKAVQGFILKKPSRLRFNPASTRYLVSYKEVDGKYHVSYLRYELEFYADWRRRLFRTGYTIMSEMAITGRSRDNVTRFAPKESFRSTNILADQVPVYFEDEFWGEYNYIEPDQTINAAIRKMNKRLDW
jgi:hypothetical protein